MTEENVEVYVCVNVDCRSRGAEVMLANLKQQLGERGMDHIKPEPIMCFAACNVGPNVVIPSKRCWLSSVTKNDVGEVIDYLNGARVLPRLQEKNDPELNKMIFDMIDAGLLGKVDSV